MVNAIEIEYLQPKVEFRIGNVKNIAVPSNNKDDIKKAYPTTSKVESNADMLSQSFGTTPEIVSIPTNNEIKVESEPVQISAIAMVNNSNLESTPVDLNMSAPIVNIPEIQPVVSEVPTVEVVPEPLEQEQVPVPEFNTSVTSENVNNIEAPKMDIPVIENSFKVSSAPNIFDNPVPTVETNNLNVEEVNVFSQPEMTNNVIPNNTIEKSSIDYETLNDDIILAEIAILESDIKHYEGLAQNNRQKIELLKKQMNKKIDNNLENTASDLFNNNGVLDEDKVLGKIPMPNLKS